MYCGTDEMKFKPEFKPTSYINEPGLQKRSNASEIFQWVQRVLENVAWMENALLSGYRMIGDLKEV